MAISTAAPSATFDVDPPFLLRHPRNRAGRGFLSWFRAEPPPRVILPRLEPQFVKPTVEPEPLVRIAAVELPLPQPVLDPVPVERVTIEPAPIEAPEQIPVERVSVEEESALQEPEADLVAAPPISIPAVRRRRGWLARLAIGLLSAAAYTVASLMLLAAAPLYLALAADRQEVVRWSNDLLDMVLRW